MTKKPLADPLLLFAGVVTWLAASTPLLFEGARRPELFGSGRYLSWFIAFAAFGLGFAFGARLGSSPRREQLGVVIQWAAACVAVATFPFSLVGIPANAILFVIVAARLAFLPGSTALGVITLQTLFLAVVFGRIDELGSTGLLVISGTYFGFQLFAYYVARLATRESALRRKLSLTVTELEATRELLAEGTRIAERARISRDLHDILGHHLSALALNLELARHQDADEAQKSVETAASLCRLLLTDVRQVVSDLRNDDSIDLERAIHTLTKDIPAPQITTHFDESFRLADPLIAEVLLRCSQEAITNTIRHANASELTLDYAGTARGLRLSIRDNGTGTADPEPGHGWTGMQERLAAVEGTLSIDTAPAEGGMSIEIEIPIQGESR